MGIRRLKQLLNSLCVKKGIHHFLSVNDFITSEKKRLYQNAVKECHSNNPIKQMQLKKNINNSPYIVGIDANLYIAKYSRIFKKIEYGFLRQILLTLSSKMVPLYIFDGNFPDQKKTTVNNRRDKKRKNRKRLDNLLYSKGISNETLSSLDSVKLIEYINSLYEQNDVFVERKNTLNVLGDYNNLSMDYQELLKLYQKSINVTYNEIQNLQKFLDLLNIPYIVANNEADDMLAYLYHQKIIQACQSDDMDMLPKGCGNFIQITNIGVVQYLLSEILQELKLTQNQFIDMCVLLGSDYYTDYLPKIDAINLYTSFKSLNEPSLENFVLYYANMDPSIKSHLDPYLKARKSFFIACNESLDKIPKILLIPFSFDRIMGHLQDLGIPVDHKDTLKLKYWLKNANGYINELCNT